jgi:hypothetical protein
MEALLDMALTKADRDSIKNDLREEIHGTGWRKLGILIRTWSLPSVAVAFILFLWSQWGTYVEFRTHTGDRLDGVEKSLARLELRNQASLSQSTFEKALADLKTVITTARKKDVRVSPLIVEDLQAKLVAANHSAPDYWPTAAEFITYRSHLGTGSAPSQLANCTDSLPTISKVLESTPSTLEVTPGVYENCRVTLDSAEDDKRINEILSERSPTLTFRHCVVVYRGGSVNLILSWSNRPIKITEGAHPAARPPTFGTVSTPNTIKFEDCLFDFSIQATPPPEGQRATETLLAQNGNTVIFPQP